MPNFFCYDGFLSIIQMCCFRLLHETISLQFGYKDSANRRQCTICKDKNCKLQPYLTFIFTQISQKREVKEVKEVKEEVSLSEAKKRRMSKPRKLPKGSEKTIVFNFFNFFNFLNFLNFLELSTCES